MVPFLTRFLTFMATFHLDRLLFIMYEPGS